MDVNSASDVLREPHHQHQEKGTHTWLRLLSAPFLGAAGGERSWSLPSLACIPHNMNSPVVKFSALTGSFVLCVGSYIGI